MTGRAGITHYTWPGGLAVVFETPAAGIGAVFGPAGWQLVPGGSAAASVPPGAARAHLPLPEDVVAQCMELEFAGGALHTDFVRLERFVRRLQADGSSAVLFVLGAHPAALVIAEGAVTAFDPAAPDASEDAVINRAAGWIVHLAGRMRAPAPPPGQETPAASPAPEAAPVPVPAGAPADGATGVEVPSHASVDPPAPGHDAVLPAAAAPSADAVAPEAPPPAAPPGEATFGRFSPDARFLRARGIDATLPDDVRAEIVAAAGIDPLAVLPYLDGGRTLAEVAAASGLPGTQLAAVLDVLVARRLAFRYVVRARPPAGAPRR
ncbi:MAG: hypothetical protein QN157_12915 [Armatimonadota bacterium]|nr:hypothetical protein [Armatimonadota bacterium]